MQNEAGRSVDRRAFFKGAAAVAVGGGAALQGRLNAQTLTSAENPSAVNPNVLDPNADPANASASPGQLSPTARADRSFQIRVQAATAERNVPIPSHPVNGDEARYPNRIGNYSKALPHNEFGEVDTNAYNTLLTAIETGRPSDFENITLSPSATHQGPIGLLTNPQSGLAFDLEGTDSHQVAIHGIAAPAAFPPSPAVASAERAGEMVENYWMALTRDVPFSQYGHEPLTQAAITDLNRMSDFRGPKVNGQVTPETLFRGSTAGETVGPYVSQFFLLPAPFGALAVNDRFGNPAQQYNVYQPGVDYMTTVGEFLNVQNGGATGKNVVIGPRYLSTARSINAFVHVDELYQAYFMATLNLLDQMKVPFNPGNPYRNSRTQTGFGTFGNPHAVALVAEVSTRALKSVWYQKWFVHRALRSEAFGGLVHFLITKDREYPLHNDVLNSSAVKAVFSKNGTYFLPMAFPEGCPTHPSYGAGHATVAGACATFIKAFFDENHPILNPVVASLDGQSLIPYTGPGAAQLAVKTEANKIAGNVGIARNSAGVHWRSDQANSVLLGEAIAISIMRDQRPTYNENFQGFFKGFTFTKFDGTPCTV